MLILLVLVQDFLLLRHTSLSRSFELSASNEVWAFGSTS